MQYLRNVGDKRVFFQSNQTNVYDAPIAYRNNKVTNKAGKEIEVNNMSRTLCWISFSIISAYFTALIVLEIIDRIVFVVWFTLICLV